MMTNYGKSGLALALAGSMTLPTMGDVGTGSAAIAVTRSGLATPAATTYFTTRDIGTQKQVTYTFDYSSITLSGLLVKEFGIRTSGGGLGSGTFFNIDNSTAVQYDGTNELQLQVTFQVF